MEAEEKRVVLGAGVYSSDGERLGEVKRIWWADGRVEPPEEPYQGGLVIGSGRKESDPYFQLDRFLAADWYVPFSAVESSSSDRVMLGLTAEEAMSRAWQEKPM